MSAIEPDDRGLIVTCSVCGKNNRLAYERLGQTANCANCHTRLPMPAEPIAVDDTAAFDALVVRSSLPVLVDFWAEWCGPCKAVAPAVAHVAGEGQGRWIVAKADTELLTATAQRFRINSIPTFVVLANGRELARQSGAMPAVALRTFVEKSIPAPPAS